MAAGDGTRLNLAAQLATAAADLQKARGARAASKDVVVLAAFEHVTVAVRSLCAAVAVLAVEVESPDA